RRSLRSLVVPRARVHLLEPSVLLVLRARAAAVGPLSDARPEPRRHPHERRADGRLPARDRLVRLAVARGGGRARPPRSNTSREIAALVGTVVTCCSSSSSTTTWDALP